MSWHLLLYHAYIPMEKGKLLVAFKFTARGISSAISGS